MEGTGRLAALQAEADNQAATIRQLKDELAARGEEMEFLKEELQAKKEELEEVSFLIFFIYSSLKRQCSCRQSIFLLSWELYQTCYLFLFNIEMYVCF